MLELSLSTSKSCSVSYGERWGKDIQYIGFHIRLMTIVNL